MDWMALSSSSRCCLCRPFLIAVGGVIVTREGRRGQRNKRERKGDNVRERNTLLSMVHDIIVPGAAD
jgi:hypothetical protein